MLYYSFGYSYIQYRITVWDTPVKSLLHKIDVRQNNILRTISWSKKYDHVSKHYKSFELLKLQDIYELELEKLMLKTVNNKLLLNVIKNFTALQDVHSYHTQQTKNSIFFLPYVLKAFAQNELAFRGTKLSSELNDNLKHLTIICFK